MYKSSSISVIIPVFNSERFVAEAIDSVVNQTLKPSQVILIDDGSTDGSAAIMKSYSDAIYHHQQNGGLCSALNAGLKLVNGEYIAFLDSDDYWELDKLNLQMQFLSENPQCDGVFGNHKRFYNKPKLEYTTAELADSKRVLPAKFKASLLIRKESFFKVGLFDEAISMGDFLDWYRRAMDMELQFGVLNEIVFRRRIHDANSSLKNKGEMGDYVKLLKASIDRRRKAGKL